MVTAYNLDFLMAFNEHTLVYDKTEKKFKAFNRIVEKESKHC